MVASPKLKRLRPSVDSPSKGINLSWVPDGRSLFIDNDAGPSSHPSLLGTDGGHADIQSLSVGGSHGFDGSNGSTDSNKGKGTKKVVDDDEPWEEGDEEYVGINDEKQYLSD
ncbi:hypothetical protein GUJ93_ZPchr0009g1188 [Zizania palustris]|uniref:Uncharacterized protein n=1 Tax=Zizania palustris TaxID=103762 RepID=A0A8J5V7M1_ZIZPA|nr:hypothetical protein GUJ93_ZPchr0009g1188 [Zizania palustris]